MLMIGGVALLLIAMSSWYFIKISSGGYAKDIQAYFNALNMDGLNTIEAIDQALTNQEIDSETALLYKVYAVFGDERLPEEFYVQRPFRNGTEIMKELNNRWDRLSPDTQALLAPFRKRPDEAGSWMDLRFKGAADGEKMSWLIPDAYASRVSAYTDFFTSDDDNVKIWYPNVSGEMNNIYNPGKTQVDAATGKAIAKRLKNFLDFDFIIDDYQELLSQQLMSDGTKGGDSKYDIYVAPCGGDLGLTYAEKATPTPSYIIMNYAIGLKDDNVLKTTLAHELFHAFQYTYDYDAFRDNWWSEATAVWSEDYVYPHVNSEHGFLKRFIWFPETQGDKEAPPSAHHYGAYILPYFITEQFGHDFMRKSWEQCENGKCIDGIDENIDGGFKKQWKEFTLWNYNKEPAKYYTDVGSFPQTSSLSSGKAEDVFIMATPMDIEVPEINPLAADLSTVHNALEKDTPIKKLTFKDLKKFTDQSDMTGIKAVIYYKNGKKDVEDWTGKEKRSFCIASETENFERVVLIFSNGDKERAMDSATLKVEGKNDCFYIDKEADRTAVMHFPYYDGGMKVVDINTTIDTLARGETAKDAPEDAEFGYQTEWRVKYEFQQVKDAFAFTCQGGTIDYEPGWTTRAAGYLTFDLNPESEGYKDHTFPVDMHYGEIHPDGPYEDVPTVNIQCAGFQIGATKIDLSNHKGVYKGIYTGRITDMTPDSATIEIPNCCLYHNCTTQQGAPFQSISKPVLLEIKRKNNG